MKYNKKDSKILHLHSGIHFVGKYVTHDKGNSPLMRDKVYKRDSFCKILSLLFCFKSFMEKLYIIKCNKLGEEFIKVGITSNTIQRRFGFGNSNKMPYWYDIMFLTQGNPMKIMNCESYISNKFREFSYEPNIKFAGYMECYDQEIINEIISEIHYFLSK